MKGKREEPKSRENSPLSRRTAPLGDPFAEEPVRREKPEKPDLAAWWRAFWDSGKGKILVTVLGCLAVFAPRRSFPRHTASISLAIRQDCCGKSPCLTRKILVHPASPGSGKDSDAMAEQAILSARDLDFFYGAAQALRHFWKTMPTRRRRAVTSRPGA